MAIRLQDGEVQECVVFLFLFFLSDSRLKQGVGLVEDVICSGRGSLQFKRAI